jgi:hypothetical protein
VHNDFWRKDKKYMLDQAQSKSKAGPVVSVFHDLQSIPVKLDISVKVHSVESLHRNLVLSVVRGLVGFFLEGKIMLDGTTWVLGLLILPRAVRRSQKPETDQDGDCGEESEEQRGLQSTANLERHVCWYNCNESEQEEVGEAGVAGGICWERRILDSWVLQDVS